VDDNNDLEADLAKRDQEVEDLIAEAAAAHAVIDAAILARFQQSAGWADIAKPVPEHEYATALGTLLRLYKTPDFWPDDREPFEVDLPADIIAGSCQRLWDRLAPEIKSAERLLLLAWLEEQNGHALDFSTGAEESD
jgi:hypothetical protein